MLDYTACRAKSMRVFVYGDGGGRERVLQAPRVEIRQWPNEPLERKGARWQEYED